MPYGIPIISLVEEDILKNAQKQAKGGTAEALQAESDANSMNITAEDAPPVNVPLARAGVGEGATVKPGRTGSYVAGEGPRDAGSNPAAAGGSQEAQDGDEMAKAKERYAEAYKASNDSYRNANIMQGGVQIGRALAGMPIEKQINRSYVEDATKRFGTPDALRSQEEAVIKDILARKQAAKQFGDQMAWSKDQFGQKMTLDRDQMLQAKAIADEQLKVQMANAKTQQDQLQAQINHQNAMEKIGWYQARTGRINATETKDAAKQAKADELARKLKERETGAFTFADGRIPSEDDAKKMKDGEIAVTNIKNNLKQLDALVKKHGSELYGPIAAKMSGLYEDTKVQVKNAQELGALSKDDARIIEGQFIDPTGSSGFNSRTETMRGSYNNLHGLVNEKALSSASARGYKPRNPDEWKKLDDLNPDAQDNVPQVTPQAAAATRQPPPTQPSDAQDVMYTPDGRPMYFNPLTKKYQSINPLQQQKDLFK